MDASPLLPPELEHKIFELTAIAHPDSKPNFLLVARRAYVWVQPLLWRTLSVPKFDYTRALRQNPAHARTLLAHTERAIMRIPTWQHDFVYELLTVLSMCPSLTRLAFDRYSNRIHRTLRFLLPTFTKLQRLTVHVNLLFEYEVNTLWLDNAFPALANLAFNDLRPREIREVLRPRSAQTQTHPGRQLKIILNRMSPPTRGSGGLGLFIPFTVDLPPEFADEDWQFGDIEAELGVPMPRRFVMKWNTSWADGVDDAPNMWTRAEEFLQRKRRGEIAPECFWMDGSYSSELDGSKEYADYY
ncbi:hypothetical protein HMN09_01173200 [Mycena chlorophos]|uniref:Uncharacterized protein n=1 Tax=Mycena chlorophos TaxID=658473 RepID=A0A8H6VXH2_MYCCL|nr:hypothetical protein HMN09_01173200 [Mycena chlorophos]